MNLMGGMHDDGKRVELRLNSSSCERNTKAGFGGNLLGKPGVET
jgi:hypothetical protein